MIAEKTIYHNSRSFIPDRVVIKNNQATVIDYKSGAQEEKHKKQINTYADLLLKMGYKDVKKYLLYTTDLAVVEVN